MPKGRGAGRTKKHRPRKPVRLRRLDQKMGTQAGDFGGGLAGDNNTGLNTATPSGR